MSWDILALIAPADARTPSAIPDDYSPPGIGSREVVLAALASKHVLAVSGDSSWVVIEGIDAGVEVRLVEAENEVVQMTFHAHDGPDAASFVLATCRDLGLQSIDLQTGEFLDDAGAAASYRDWLRSSGRSPQ